MRKIYKTIIISFIYMSVSSGQTITQPSDTTNPSKYHWLSRDSWVFGAGITYPRYISTNVIMTGETGYGGYLSMQKNFSEHIGVRLKGSYLHLEGKDINIVNNNLVLGDVDFLFYVVPCELISPYAGVGVGVFYHTIDHSPDTTLNKSSVDYELNLLFGAEWWIVDKWKLKTELSYHTPASAKFDGVYGTTGNGVLGGILDSYMSFDLGVVYYFAAGEKSNICDIYDGINAKFDYGKIEEIVKRYAVQPADLTDYNRIEDIVKKYKSTVTTVPENWVLLGVNFDFNKATLRPESLPILYNAADILLTNPNVNVEIQGHTDNVGSDSFNQKLSFDRVIAVRNFLIAKGVAPNRLMMAGFGKSKPIMDNSTLQGRELNRRIEFRILNK